MFVDRCYRGPHYHMAPLPPCEIAGDTGGDAHHIAATPLRPHQDSGLARGRRRDYPRLLLSVGAG